MIRLLPLLLLAACGTPEREPDFVTTRGVKVFLYADPIDPAVFDEMDEYVAAYAPAAGERCISGMSAAVFTSDDLNIMWHERGARGQVGGFLDGNIAKLAWAEDGWDTAYVHESMHWLQRCAWGAADANHEDTGLWAYVNAAGAR